MIVLLLALTTPPPPVPFPGAGTGAGDFQEPTPSTIAPGTITERQVPHDSTHLTLDQVVERALASYPTAAAARARADGAAADVGVARAAWLPRVSLDGSLYHFQEPMVVAPLHGFDIQNPPQFDRTLIQPQASFSWTLFDLGRIPRIHAEKALSGAADAAVEATDARLMSDVVSSYLAVLTARDELTAEDQHLAALLAEAHRTSQMLAEGKAARIDVLRVDAEAKRARADRIAGAAQLDVAEHRLAQLAGLSYDVVHAASLAGLALADTSLAGDTTAAQREPLVRRALSESPEILQGEQQARAAGAGLAAARAAWVPQLRVGGAYTDYGSGSGTFAPQWQLGIAISYPLFTGGSRVSAIRRAAADDRAATEQLRAAQLAVAQGVDQALAALREAHARVAALESAVAQSEEVTHIERLSLDVGSGTETDYLDAEAKLLSARAALIEARHAEISACVMLARTTGELSRDWLAQALETIP
jgi:outer membrane protein